MTLNKGAIMKFQVLAIALAVLAGCAAPQAADPVYPSGATVDSGSSGASTRERSTRPSTGPVYTGPKGGQYTITPSGKKRYLPKK